jgi:DNA-binding NarL/FixJ family response regulator
MRVLVVDDDRLVALSLKTIIEAAGGMEVAGTGHGGAEAVALYERLFPDVLLMDIRMDGMTGLDAGEAILRAHPGAKVLFLTTFSDDEYIVRALKMGAKGYILKQDFESIVPALKAVHAGQSVFGGDVVAKIPSLISDGGRADFSGCGLTDKEGAIVELVAEGLSNREIAAKLYLGEGTVRNAISVILEKLGLKGRTQMAIFYYRSLGSGGRTRKGEE